MSRVVKTGIFVVTFHPRARARVVLMPTCRRYIYRDGIEGENGGREAVIGGWSPRRP